MEKKIYNVADWLQKKEPVAETTLQNDTADADTSELECILSQIEEKKVDIASAYADWRNIGFAFADTYGEKGRSYFHRVSCFYPAYTKSECDQQYDNCLKANGTGVTMKTFFYLAKNAGINITAPEASDDLPTFPEELYSNLPDFLQKTVAIASNDEERDIILLSSLVAISACLPKLSGIYDGKKVFANLYLFVTAQASAGKGRMEHCKQLVMPIHKLYREQTRQLKLQHNLQLAEYNEKKGKDYTVEKPQDPPEKMLLMPANNSATGLFQLMYDSGGRGLIFETEGDTLSQALKTDYGNYSDGFRKAFHHEMISYYRRTNRENVEIEKPCLSTVLSGTPRQVAALIPDAENGLFSRFMFYFMNVKVVWKDVFSFSNDNGLDEYYNGLGAMFFRFYQSLEANPDIQFGLTADQQQQFNLFFQQVQETYITLKGLDYMATVRRLGLIGFRICMILSVLRIMETGEQTTSLVCEERDFRSAIAIIKVLVKHAAKVYSELPEAVQLPRRKNQKEKFIEALPKEFNRQDYLKVAAKMNIPFKTAEFYITEFCKRNLLHHEKKDHYVNSH